jgi:hypothetical protein
MRGRAARSVPSFAALLAALALLAAACRPATERTPAESRAAEVSDFELTIVQSGGIAGFVTMSRVDGATMTWAQTRGRGPAADSASGTLPERDVRVLRALVAAEWDALLDDYGRSEGAADLFEYEIDARLGDRAKRITGDDLTLPPELLAIRDALFQAIDSARGR